MKSNHQQSTITVLGIRKLCDPAIPGDAGSQCETLSKLVTVKHVISLGFSDQISIINTGRFHLTAMPDGSSCYSMGELLPGRRVHVASRWPQAMGIKNCTVF